METLDIFDFDDYKAFLRQALKGEGSKWGSIGLVATSIGCQRSYLSRVLSDEAELSQDHAFAAAEYFKLTDVATEYFLLLVDRARSGSARYSSHLEKKLMRLKKKRNEIPSRIKRQSITTESEYSVYYSAWYFSAIHILLSIPGHSHARDIAKRLQLPIELVSATLDQLLEMGLVEKEGAEWKFKSEIHVPKFSNFVLQHHSSWRQRALLSAELRSEPQSLNFTVVQSFSMKDFEIIKSRLLSFIEQASLTMNPSPAEELFCFNCDLFRV